MNSSGRLRRHLLDVRLFELGPKGACNLDHRTGCGLEVVALLRVLQGREGFLRGRLRPVSE